MSPGLAGPLEALPLHELNTGFSWKPISGPFRRIDPSEARQYNEAGYFVLKGALDADTVELLIREIDPVEARVEQFLREHAGGRHWIARSDEITFSTHLVTRSEALQRFVKGPLFQDLAYDILGPDVRLYWDQAVYKKPGTRVPFPWHQDNGYAFIEPQQYLTCWIALSDTDEHTGGPWIVPGLHARGTLRHRKSDLGWVCLEETPPSAVPVRARAGDIVVFSSLTPHTTGPHRGNEVRRAYIVQLAPDGAVVIRRDEQGETERTPANAPDRQFPILVGGSPPAS